MADNLTLPVATNEVGGFHFQKVKLVDGTAGSTALIGGDATNGLDVDVTRVGGTVTTRGDGDVAHDAADSGNPNKIGAKAKSALSGVTRVASDDRTNLYADLDGALTVREGCVGDRVSGNASNTDGSSTSCISAGGADIAVELTDVTISNTSASNIIVEIRDGAAGSVKWTFPVPANGGVTHSFSTPLVGSANTAWCFDPSAATTTVYCSMSGRKIKVA